MTDGRFEAMNSVRPSTFDNRKFWTDKGRFPGCKEDHRLRESCPFHDLKAAGCFQPESCSDSYNPRVSPVQMVRRRHGNPFNACSGTRGKNMGVGGLPLVEDVVPTGPTRGFRGGSLPAGKSKRGLFSVPPYVPCPTVGLNVKRIDTANPHFSVTMQKSDLCLPSPFMDRGGDRTAKPITFRLKAGKYKSARLADVLHPVSVSRQSPKVKIGTRRSPFSDFKPMKGTFAFFPPYIAAPFNDKTLHTRTVRPMLTYSTKTKSTAPVQVPWSTMLQTGDPLRGF